AERQEMMEIRIREDARIEVASDRAAPRIALHPRLRERCRAAEVFAKHERRALALAPIDGGDPRDLFARALHALFVERIFVGAIGFAQSFQLFSAVVTGPPSTSSRRARSNSSRPCLAPKCRARASSIAARNSRSTSESSTESAPL